MHAFNQRRRPGGKANPGSNKERPAGTAASHHVLLPGQPRSIAYDYSRSQHGQHYHEDKVEGDGPTRRFSRRQQPHGGGQLVGGGSGGSIKQSARAVVRLLLLLRDAMPVLVLTRGTHSPGPLPARQPREGLSRGFARCFDVLQTTRMPLWSGPQGSSDGQAQVWRRLAGRGA